MDQTYRQRKNRLTSDLKWDFHGEHLALKVSCCLALIEICCVEVSTGRCLWPLSPPLYYLQEPESYSRYVEMSLMHLSQFNGDIDIPLYDSLKVDFGQYGVIECKTCGLLSDV